MGLRRLWGLPDPSIRQKSKLGIMLPRPQTLARLLHHLGTQLNPEPLGGRGVVSVIRLPYQDVSTTCLDVRGRWIRQPEALGEGTESDSWIAGVEAEHYTNEQRDLPWSPSWSTSLRPANFGMSNTDCGSVWNIDFVSALDSSQAFAELKLFGSGVWGCLGFGG